MPAEKAGMMRSQCVVILYFPVIGLCMVSGGTLVVDSSTLLKIPFRLLIFLTACDWKTHYTKDSRQNQ